MPMQTTKSQFRRSLPAVALMSAMSFSGVADGSFTHPRKSAPSPVPSSSRETASSASGLSASNFSLTAASAASWILMSIVFIAVGCVWFKRGCGRKCCAVEHKSVFGFLF